MEYARKDDNASDRSDELRKEPVRPLLMISFGTTQAAAVCAIASQIKHASETVPVAFLFFDTMQREAVRDRCHAFGITPEVFDTICTPANFFRLSSPFSPAFDFRAELNRKWKRFVHQEQLEKVCAGLGTNGAAGTPAAGACFVLGSCPSAVRFIRKHVQGLTAVADDKMNLEANLLVLVHTSLRGGTGTGGYAVFGALVREAVGRRAEIRTRVLMPGIFGGDDQSNANAYATLMSSNDAHSRDGGVMLLDTAERCHAPYNGETLFFGSNGHNSIVPKDVVGLQVMTTLPYALPEVQRIINGFRVDNVSSAAFTPQGKPMNTVVETAVSIEACPTWIPKRVAISYLEQGLDAAVREASRSLELRIDELTSAERDDLLARVRKLVTGARLDQPNLLRRIAGDAMFQATTTCQKAHQALSEVDNDTLGEAVPKETRGISTRLAGLVKECEKRALTLSADITAELAAALDATPGPQGLMVASAVLEHLRTCANAVESEAQACEKQIKNLNAAFNEAMRDFNDALNAPWIYRRWNCVRDAAKNVLDCAQAAALMRLRERVCKLLADALKTGGYRADDKGDSAPIAAVIDAVDDWFKRSGQQAIRALNQKMATLKPLKSSLDLAINTRSSYFQRFILGDKENVDDLVREGERIFQRDPHLPPLEDLIAGKLGVDQAIAALLPTMPYYSQLGSDIQELIQSDPHASDMVVHLIRNAMPFARIDKVVEQQQCLSKRRDTLKLLVLPGGPEGPIAEILSREGLIDDSTRVVATRDNRILYYYLREALPLFVLSEDIAELRRSFEVYMAQGGVQTPFWNDEGPKLAHIEAPSDNLRATTGKLLARALVVASDLVFKDRTGCRLIHHEEVRPGFSVPKEESFDTFEQMRDWVENRSRILSDISGVVQKHWKNNPDAHEQALVKEFRNTRDSEQKELLKQALYDMKINPEASTRTKSVKSSAA